MNTYKIIIRYFELKPTEDFVQYAVEAEDESKAKKKALTKFWEGKCKEPQAVFEVDDVIITQV
jgi:hypothetical protein